MTESNELEDTGYEVVSYDGTEDEEWCVVCTSCRNVQDPESVERSAWYKNGMMPPCFGCGGVCREIPVSHYGQFVKDSEAGKFFG